MRAVQPRYSSGQSTLALFPNFVTFLMKSVNSAEFEVGLSINIWSISFGDTKNRIINILRVPIVIMEFGIDSDIAFLQPSIPSKISVPNSQTILRVTRCVRMYL